MDKIKPQEDSSLSTAPGEVLDEERSKFDKMFFKIFLFFIFGSVFLTFWRITISENYLIEAEIDCDPYSQSCFIWECDPNSTIEGEACTGNPEEDTSYYGLVHRRANLIPLCDPKTDESCTALICKENEPDCEQIFCTEENKVLQETECSNPEEYTKNNPVVEDEAEEIGDEENENSDESEESSENSDESTDESTEEPTQE